MSTPADPAALPYRPQLDGLRACAVGAVLVHHFLPKFGPLSYGVLGVRLFFVLSGFLITSILLGCRDIAESTPCARLFLARQFYARRFLRIFPLYYFVVGLAAALNLEPVRDLIGWLLSYSLNIQMSLTQQWPDHVSHFWSLAVEEQFYILWPWFILFAPRRTLLSGTILVILAAPLYRLFAVTIRENWVSVYTLTPALADTLGVGALLALFIQPGYSQTVCGGLRKLSLPFGLLTVIALEFIIRSKSAHAAILYAVFYDVGLALAFFWLVAGAARGFAGLGGWILPWAPLVYLGKISYGIYVYHPFTPTVTRWILQRLGWPLPPEGLARLLLFSLVTVGFASVSWHLMEFPLNRLKRHFLYKPPAPHHQSNPVEM